MTALKRPLTVMHIACPFHTALPAATLRNWGRTLLASFALLLSASAFAAPFTIAASRTPLSLPLYIAQEKGFFANQNLAVDLVDCLGGHRCMKQMLDGHAELATAADLPVTLNSFERNDFVVVGTLVTNPNDIKLVVRSELGNSDPSRLVGRRIGIVAGTSSQFFLSVHLLTVGVDPQNVVQVALQPEEMLAALRDGKVDAIAVWEPYAYQAAKALAPAALALPGTGVYTETFNLMAQRKLATEQPAVLTRLLQAVDQAEQFIRDNPEGAKAILRRRLQLDQAFVDSVWPGMSYRLSLDQSLLSTLESQARWARRESQIAASRATPNFLGMISTAPLLQVKPTAVTLPH